MNEFFGEIVKIKKLMQALTVAGTMMIAANSHAAATVQVGGIDLTGSGFLTLGVGSMLGGTHQNVNDYNRPCFASDYAQAGVFDNSDLQWKPDTKLGVQGTATFPNKRFSITAQAVSRGAKDGNVNLEWLYASYKLNDQWTLQGGRKRLPMFYYSDTQDIGVALPWTHLPPQLYGWEAVNYNGVNLSYQGQWGDWSANADLLTGFENKHESGYWKIYNGRKNRTDIIWDDIIGGDLTLSKDWLETRFVYIQSRNKSKIVSGVWDQATQSYDPTTVASYGESSKQKIYGVAVNIDYNHWLMRNEAIMIEHSPISQYRDTAYIVGVGYRYGKWQPMVTWSRYHSIATYGASPTAQEGHRNIALTLRYDLTTSSDIKVQLDFQRDLSGANWHPNWSGAGDAPAYGDARLLTVTYDMVF